MNITIINWQIKKTIQFLLVFLLSLPLYSIELKNTNSLLLRYEDIKLKESTTEFVYKNDYFAIKPEIKNIDLENLSVSFDPIVLSMPYTSITYLGISNRFYINTCKFDYHLGYTFFDDEKYRIGFFPIDVLMDTNISCGLSFSIKDYFSIQINDIFLKLYLTTPFAINEINGYGNILYLNLQNIIHKNNWSLKTNAGFINAAASCSGDLYFTKVQNIFLDLGIKTSLFYIRSEYQFKVSNFTFAVATGYYYLPFLKASISLNTDNLTILKGFFKYNFESIKEIEKYGLIPIELSSSMLIKDCITLGISKCFYIPVLPDSDDSSSGSSSDVETSYVIDYLLSGLSFIVSVKL